jgi:hypothetical protein
MDRLEAARALAEQTDFARFKSVELLDALAVHRRTHYYSARFGTALAARPAHQRPPDDVAEHEARYVEQLLAVYAERRSSQNSETHTLAANPTVGRHFRRPARILR